MPAITIKLIALCGSPRKEKSRTAQLVQEVLAAAEEKGAQTECLDTRLKINPCLACDRCHSLGCCVQKDDFNSVFEKMLTADGIVLGSPVYIYQVLAQLKMFIDRLGHAIHCQRLLGKYGAAVVTAGGSGHLETAEYLEQLFLRLGAQCVGKLACTLEDGPVGLESAWETRELSGQLVEAIATARNFPARSGG